MVYPGQVKRWSERHPVSLQLGNPAGVKVVVNGKNKIARGVTQPVTLAWHSASTAGAGSRS